MGTQEEKGGEPDCKKELRCVLQLPTGNVKHELHTCTNKIKYKEQS